MIPKEEHKKHDQEAEKAILNNVEEYGCEIGLFQPSNYLPGFAYTIGLFKNYSHPEIICFGLTTDLHKAILNHALKLIQNEKQLITGKYYDGFLENYPVQFLAIDKAYYPDYFGYARWFYNNSWDFPALQLIWPDKQSQWPWDKNFNPDWRFKQPLLDRNTDFKFYEPRNLAVFTTEEVLQGDPILFVFHNLDGEWQFHSSSEPDIAKAKIVCLEDIVHKDKSLNSLFGMELGYVAHRKSLVENWIIEQDEVSSMKDIT